MILVTEHQNITTQKKRSPLIKAGFILHYDYQCNNFLLPVYSCHWIRFLFFIKLQSKLQHFPKAVNNDRKWICQQTSFGSTLLRLTFSMPSGMSP